MIVFFLEGTYPDYNQRYLSDILAYNDEQMEKIHDYIQWVFPLDTASNFVHHAPVLEQDEIDDIHNSTKALENLIRSKNWFIKFLCRTDRWLVSKNHNHKRISRMIRSLRLLHSNKVADDCISQIINLSKERGFINSEVISHWRKC